MSAGPGDPNPLISVYIPTRDRPCSLKRAIASVLAQGRSDIEIVVVDDASEDDISDTLVEIQSPVPVRLIRLRHSVGGAAARNIAISNAQGRYITGLDDDDEMLPGRLNLMLSALRAHHSFVFASDEIVSDRRRMWRLSPWRVSRGRILQRNVVGNQIFAEKAKVVACGGFDELLPAAQDYDLWIRMILEHGPARGLMRPLQRIHAHSGVARISTSGMRRRGYWLVYCKHRSQMGASARRGHLYNLRRRNGHDTRLPRDFRFFAPGNRLRVVWHAFGDFLFRGRPH